jgi:hypothetical protein
MIQTLTVVDLDQKVWKALPPVANGVINSAQAGNPVPFAPYSVPSKVFQEQNLRSYEAVSIFSPSC